ncbi:MAG: PQQ-dependent sugar dehydrogenase [Candidatus Campbellbacteria bacterium]|nr:PQQ-dependent sugar dehydrogenase [Candidatus Campbellbacteria bacterium]
MSNRLLITTLVFVITFTLVFIFKDDIKRYAFSPRESDIPEAKTDNLETGDKDDEEERDPIEIISTNLEVPWEVAFLPDGDILITERTGFLKRIPEEGDRIEVEGVVSAGEGGLLGLTLHPDFESNNYIYLYHTTETSQGLRNRVVRYEYNESELSNPEVIIEGIPGANYHDGGRIDFGPDEKLYITTGDAGVSSLAQDTSSLAGKILRLNDDGSIPEDNPFNNAVWSYGHRNPQGIAWDESGNMWSTEHGPSGSQTGYDEVNLIEPGVNYGWPIVRGSEAEEGMRSPVLHSGADETWAPAGLVTLDEDTLLFTGLRGSSVYKLELDENNEAEELTRFFSEDYGRLRAISTGIDGGIYVTTSNTDGRGSTLKGDDKLIRFSSDVFAE